MAVKIKCPKCDDVLIVQEAHVNMKVKCQNCGNRFYVRRSPSAARNGDRKVPVPASKAPAKAAVPQQEPASSTSPTARKSRFHIASWLTSPFLLLIGVSGMFASLILPFYASASPHLWGPDWWSPWSTGMLENRVLLVLQGLGLAGVLCWTIRLSSGWLRFLSIVGATIAFLATWLLAAGRARELVGPVLQLGAEWWGLGPGAGLFLLAAAFSVAAGLRNVRAAEPKPIRRAIWATMLCYLVLFAIGTVATKIWEYAGLERFRLDATVVAARDVCGLEIPGSVAVQLRVTNLRQNPALIVARRGGQYGSRESEVPVYRLRVKARAGDRHWRHLQQPAWSGPWPELDFRSSRELGTGEAWELESPVYRNDVALIGGGRPLEVMVELTDAKRQWFLRRILAVRSETRQPSTIRSDEGAQ